MGLFSVNLQFFLENEEFKCEKIIVMNKFDVQKYSHLVSPTIFISFNNNIRLCEKQTTPKIYKNKLHAISHVKNYNKFIYTYLSPTSHFSYLEDFY